MWLNHLKGLGFSNYSNEIVHSEFEDISKLKP